MDFTFTVDGRPLIVKMSGKIAVNDSVVHLDGCLRGSGIIQAPLFMAAPHLRSGALQLVLPISALYPHNRHLSPTLRLFVDWAVELFDNNATPYGRE